MFEWLKNKINLVPSDIDKGFMSSNFCTFKLGTKLTIPENIKCYVYYKDKFYLDLSTGEHILDDKVLTNLCTKQKVSNKSKIDADLFFINLNALDLNFSYKDAIPFKKQKSKQIFFINFTGIITDPRKFANQIMGFYSSVYAWQSVEFVCNILQEQIQKYFAHKILDDTLLSTTIKQEIKDKCTQAMKSIGIDLTKINTDFKISYNLNQQKENKQTKDTNMFEKKSILSTIKDASETHVKPKSQDSSSQSICPVCKRKRIIGSAYCHICGYKF